MNTPFKWLCAVLFVVLACDTPKPAQSNEPSNFGYVETNGQYRVLHDFKRSITCWAIEKEAEAYGKTPGVAIFCMTDAAWQHQGP